MSVKTAAQSVAVVVVGPNLKSRSGETFHVHSATCADRKRPIYAAPEHQSSWDHPQQMTSVQAIVEDVMQDIMSDTDATFGPGATDYQSYLDEFKIYACVKGLPDTEPLTEGQIEEAAPVKPAVGKRAAAREQKAAAKPATKSDATPVKRVSRTAQIDPATLTATDELYYECTQCGAAKGARCTQASGRVKTYFHSPRTKAVESVKNPAAVETAKPAPAVKPAAAKRASKSTAKLASVK